MTDDSARQPLRSPFGSVIGQITRIVVLGIVIGALLFAGYLGLAYFGI